MFNDKSIRTNHPPIKQPSPRYKEAVEEADKITEDYYADQKPNFELFNKNFNSLLESLSSFFSKYGLNYSYEGLKK